MMDAQLAAKIMYAGQDDKRLSTRKAAEYAALQSERSWQQQREDM